MELGFCCPVCGGTLERREHAAVCGNGHSFDIARQGYLHLLPPNKMHSKLPGDSREMVEARRRFLEAGYYRPFRDKLCELAKRYAGGGATPQRELEEDKPGSRNPEETSGLFQTEAGAGIGERAFSSHSAEAGVKILDAGCGEGYYTEAVRKALGTAEVYGFDISKLAMKAAAGKYKEIGFAVASSFAIPVPDGFCGCLINVFAPMAEEEFRRVVRPGGVMILAVPGERHLYGMKEFLYQEPYENEHRETEYSGFSFVSRTAVREEIWVPDAGTAMDLFAMTPYYWKTGMDGGNRLRETRGFSTEIAFDFLVYRRTER